MQNQPHDHKARYGLQIMSCLYLLGEVLQKAVKLGIVINTKLGETTNGGPDPEAHCYPTRTRTRSSPAAPRGKP